MNPKHLILLLAGSLMTGVLGAYDLKTPELTIFRRKTA